MIGNVGNLVCPVMFDLGEAMKIAGVSIMQGEDRPIEYLHLFHTARPVIVNWTGHARHVGFDVAGRPF